MSAAIICDKCHKAVYADSRSDADAYSTINITYNRETRVLHLCKACYLNEGYKLLEEQYKNRDTEDNERL